ncbi:MAG: cation:dicarboxylase symporter family transporter [Myxococcota bacterium]|nr:cation:dicarboxylase symporter family transporter [Myxococcota bacterium]
MSLSARILIGLVLGVVAGLAVGEPLGQLELLGDAYIRLLQMTVLPYVVASLVAGLGRLELAEAKRLGLWGGALLVLLWGVTFSLVVVMPLAFPRLEWASFFSTALVESSPPVDFVQLYIPSNPFHSLANNVVPAVVLFSVAVGVALISVPDRAPLLRGLDALSAALLKVNGFVVQLAPFGVFLITASSAGTMTIQQFERVQVFLLSYAAFALIATFWLLPGLLAALTPVRHRDVLRVMRDALATAFATGSAFVVIPLVAAASKELIERHADDAEEADALIDVVVPASHTFPHSAKVLTLSFVLFAGWSIDSPVPVSSYPLLAVSGIAASFGSVNVAVPFLLDLMQLPHDVFRLFVATGVINSHLGTLLQTMHVLVLTVLAGAGVTGVLRPRWKAVGRFAVGTVLIVGAAVGGTRALYATLIDTSYHKDEILGGMKLLREPVPARVLREAPLQLRPPARGDRLRTIVDRGVLRVCYRLPGTIPFAFFNARDELVGLDVEMAHSLARAVGTQLEFRPMPREVTDPGIAELLARGYCDIVMARSVVSTDAVTELAYSSTYLELNLGFVMRDHMRDEFASAAALAERDDLRIAVPDEGYYQRVLARLMPELELVPVQDIEDFLDAEEGEFDAIAVVAEEGSAWSLLRPRFGVVVPSPPMLKLPVAYPLPLGEFAWQRVVEAWLELKRTDGTVQALYDYWILGHAAEEDEPRWSVLRDVLGWID